MITRSGDSGNTGNRFALGKVYATPSILATLPAGEIIDALRRHRCGDWGSVSADDWKANDQALVEGTRLLSAYRSAAGLKFWIITEGDRSSTAILFPEEY